MTKRLLALAILTVAACSPAGLKTSPISSSVPPAPTRPPTWTPESSPNSVPATAHPSRTLTPPVTPGPLSVVVAQNNAFSIQIPSNWIVTEGARQVTGRSTYTVKYFSAVGPGDSPQPGVIIFYEWPATDVTNDNAWESAFALTALVIKSCATKLGPEKLPVDFGGEPAFGVEYADSCGAAGLLTGAVHNRVNYGALFEAPAPYYADWFETLREILLSLSFGR